MAVTRFYFFGTREEINALKQELPLTQSDRILLEQRGFDHHNKQLGVTIWDLWISKTHVSQHFVASLKSIDKKYPKMVWYGQDKQGKVAEYRGEVLSNWHNTNTPDHPGPMGALCLRYGVSYR